MCTVMLRLDPGAAIPLVLAAVRDEFADRSWDPPAAHWPDQAPGVVGGRDSVAGGTWLAVRPDRPAVAALLNGVRLPPPAGPRPSRGALPLRALLGTARLTATDLADYDGFHLLLADATAATVWTWDGVQVERTDLAPGDHIIVNEGVDATTDPLVPYFQPLLSATPAPPDGWAAWEHLLLGDGLPVDDPRALIIRTQVAHRWYGSSSASLIGLTGDSARFAFTATPQRPSWYDVTLPTPQP